MPLPPAAGSNLSPGEGHGRDIEGQVLPIREVIRPTAASISAGQPSPDHTGAKGGDGGGSVGGPKERGSRVEALSPATEGGSSGAGGPAARETCPLPPASSKPGRERAGEPLYGGRTPPRPTPWTALQGRDSQQMAGRSRHRRPTVYRHASARFRSMLPTPPLAPNRRRRWRWSVEGEDLCCVALQT